MGFIKALVCLAVMLASLARTAHGQTRVLRLATAAPDGTAWAREFRAFARDVAILTHDHVQVKWYFGGIAGSEVEVQARIERGQLDGTASAGMLCQRLAPSMRVTRLPGLYRSHAEAAYVFTRLTPILVDEFNDAGYAYLGGPGLGPDVLFSRNPVTTFPTLQHVRVWRWDLDDVSIQATNDMGMTSVPLDLEQAQGAYDQHRIDGFAALPSAAMAFQWSNNVHYVLDLRMAFMSGCLLVANRVFNAIPVEHQQSVRAAAAKAIARVSEVGRLTDEQLLGELFGRQGATVLRPSPELRGALFEAARATRARLGDRLVPAKLMKQVTSYLDEYRSTHPAER